MIFRVITISFVSLFLFIGCQTTAKEEAQLKEIQTLSDQVNGLTGKLRDKENKLVELGQTYNVAIDEDPTLPKLAEALNLSAEERAMLEARLLEEKAIDYKGVIQELLDTQSNVDILQNQLQELKQKLPSSTEVIPGDTHYNLAMKFLVEEEKLSFDQATKLVKRVALYDYLLPGFELYHYHANGVYGSFVVQGVAKVSPNTIQRRYKQSLIDAKDNAEARSLELESDIASLEDKRVKLVSDVTLLEEERSHLTEKNRDLMQLTDQLKVKNEDLVRTLSSVYIFTGTQKAMKEAGVIKKRLFGRAKISNLDAIEGFVRLDLRESNVYRINAEDYGLNKFKKISILPGFLKLNTDYSVQISPDKLEAEILFKVKTKFQGEKTLIVVK